MDKEKVLDLAKLARIEMGDEEAESLSHEFKTILGYVGEVKGISPASHKATQDESDYTLRNVMREDTNPHESGIYTEKILSQAPAREENYIKVKKIL